MLVCHCRRITDAQINSVVHAGACEPAAVVRATHAGTGCGSCLQSLRALIEQALPSDPGLDVSAALAG